MEHDDYDEIEQDFNDLVGVSLSPRGPDVLYEVIADLSLPSGALAVDVGCGEGRQAIELAHRFGLSVLGIDPLPRRIDAGRQAIARSALQTAALVAFACGTAEAIPIAEASADLVLCREMLYVVADLDETLVECRRVLRSAGALVAYQLFNTDWLEPNEAVRFWGSPEAVRRADPQHFEASVRRAGFVIDHLVDLRSETVEWAEEHDGKAGRELLAAARLLRDPARYIERFGRAAYDIKLNDAFWFIYRMIGKLTQRTYVLRAG